jgi:uncharacterized protein (TIGR02594 family)
MPRIPVYNNEAFPNASPVADQARSAATAGYYRANTIRQGFNALEQGVNRFQSGIEARQKAQEDAAAAQEIGNATAAMAQTTAKLAGEWQKTLGSADPNDPTVQQKFIDDVVTPAYDAVGEGLSTDKGRNYFAKARASAWGSIYKSTAADHSNVMSKAAVNQVGTVVKSYSDAAYFDPSNWKTHLEQSDAAVEAYKDAHGLKDTDAIGLQKGIASNIAKSAIAGMIAQNPEAAKAALEAGEFNGPISGTELATAIKQADTAIDRKAKDADAAENGAVKVKKAEAYKTLNDLEASIVTDPSTGAKSIPPDYFTKLNEAQEKYGDVVAPGTFAAAANYASVELRRNSKTDTKVSDPATYSAFSSRAASGELTVPEVYDARAHKQLSDKDFQFFKGWVGEGGKANSAERTQLREMTSYLKTFKGYIMTSLGDDLHDTWGATRSTEFVSDMMQQWQEQKAAGATPEQFKEYARKAISAYTFKTEDVDAELDRLSDEVTVPPSIEPPGYKGASRKSLDEFYSGSDTHATDANSALQELSLGETGAAFTPTSYELSAVTPTPEELSRSPVENAATMMDMNEARNKGAVMAFLKAGGSDIDPTVTKWCAAFINASLARSGLPATGKLNARSYLNYGATVAPTNAEKGDIVVLSRGRNAWEGHVGFFMGYDDNGDVMLLSGNAKNRVGIDTYPRSSVLGVRRPSSKTGQEI